MKERVAIVDKANKVIGYKLREDLTEHDCWRTAQVWIEDGKGNVLMQQRKADRKVDPLKWTCAAVGTVTGDDTYEETAVRELFEEIGLQNIELKECNIVHYRSSFGWRQSKGFTGIYTEPAESLNIQDEEVKQVQWFNKAAVLRDIEQGDPKYSSSAKVYKELFEL